MAPFAELAPRLRAIERWLLPGECLLCRQSTPGSEDDPLICGPCRSRWRPVPDPVCDRCGQPQMRGLECRVCPGWPQGFTHARSAVWLDGDARRAVHYLKYDGWWRVSGAMALTMRRLDLLTGPLCLVPVPLSVARLRLRGYNQSEHLARALARQVKGSLRPDALERVRDTGTQTALTPEARYANVDGAFAAGRVRRLRLLLVDDVFTTGATLATAAAALLAAGAQEVEAVTFARARLPVG